MLSSDVVFTGTPEAFAAHQRRIKADELKAKELARAAKVAKARAARYNLTLRAKDLKKARDRDTGGEGSAVPPARSSLRRSVSKRLSAAVSVASRASARVVAAVTSASDPKSDEQEKVEAEEEEDEEEEEEEEEVVLWMGELARALEDQESRSINAAILTAFLTEMAPDRLPEVDALLDAHAGSEEALFDALAEQYPVPVAAQQRLNAETMRALGAAIPDEADDDDSEAGFILSVMGDSVGKWAANVQGHVLKQRMLQAGASQEDVDAILSNRSDMF